MKERGFTIIEILLVTVIGGMIILMGIRQYYSYRFDADVTVIKYNVDALFAAMSSYFQANCSGSGTLSPTNITPFPPPNGLAGARNLNINTDLVPVYLSAANIMHSPIVKEGAVAPPPTQLAAYQVSFWPYIVQGIKMIQSGYAPSGPPPQFNYGTTYAIVWVPHIMVILQKPAQNSALQGMTNAKECVSLAWAPVANCTNAPALHFTHQVSFASHLNTGSSYWLTTPNLGVLKKLQAYGPTTLYVTGDPNDPNQYDVCGG